MLPKLCHLDNDLVIISMQYIYCVVHMTYIPYLGTFFFSRYSNVALARNLTNSYVLLEHSFHEERERRHRQSTHKRNGGHGNTVSMRLIRVTCRY